ncbi:hypothetical protein VCHA53O466_140032 [Vibrio chagasii]|nr:hypothetical protein VCHA53O466_140032 [Vibrio chagasii]
MNETIKSAHDRATKAQLLQSYFDLSQEIAKGLLKGDEYNAELEYIAKLISAKTVTLRDKESDLQLEDGYPEVADWSMSIEGERADELCAELNKALKTALQNIRAEKAQTYFTVGSKIKKEIEPIANQNPDADLFSSEASACIAQFIALNHNIAMRDYIRYHWLD